MLGRYRTTNPIISMFAINGHHEAKTVPAGTEVDLNGKKLNGDRLMEVTVDGHLVLMFTEDLKMSTMPI